MQNAVPYCEIGALRKAVCAQKSPTVKTLFLIKIRDYYVFVAKKGAA